MDNVTLTLKNMNHPLDKIFGGIPAGSRSSPTLQRGITILPFDLCSFIYLFGCKGQNRKNNAPSPVIESDIPPRPEPRHKKPHVTG